MVERMHGWSPDKTGGICVTTVFQIVFAFSNIGKTRRRPSGPAWSDNRCRQIEFYLVCIGPRNLRTWYRKQKGPVWRHAMTGPVKSAIVCFAFAQAWSWRVSPLSETWAIRTRRTLPCSGLQYGVTWDHSLT